MKCGDSPRTLARHNDSLNCNSFFDKCTELLADGGCVSIVIPCDIKEQWEAAAILHGLCTTRITYVKTTPRKEPKRVMLEFCKKTIDSIERNTIVLEDEPGVYSDDAKKILGDFYLKIV
jgi:tRNA1Val (adenine37-N6)-methyltransferase